MGSRQRVFPGHGMPDTRMIRLPFPQRRLAQLVRARLSPVSGCEHCAGQGFLAHCSHPPSSTR